MSNENTPSNAGKEHKWTDVTPTEDGRYLHKIDIDDEPEWAEEFELQSGIFLKDGVPYVVHGGVWQSLDRSTTPPTQSQEGETPETNYEEGRLDHYFNGKRVVYAETSKRLELRLTAAQRENDRLRSEVAKAKSAAGHIASILKKKRDSEDSTIHAGNTSFISMERWVNEILSIDAARAATEEGKRG